MSEKEPIDAEVSHVGEISPDQDLHDMQASKEIPETPRDKSQVEFVYVEHTPELAPHIAAELAEKDLILVEHMFPEERFRKFEEEIANLALKSKLTPRESVAVEAFLAGVGEEGEELPYDIGLIKGLRGTDKTMRFIDTTEDDPVIQRFDAEFELIKKHLVDGIVDFADITTLRKVVRDCAQVRGKQMTYRDKVMNEQIKVIIDETRADQKDLRIAVVQGASHTPSYKHFSKDSTMDISRKFVAEKTGDPQVQILYRHLSEMVRDISFGRTHEPDPDKVDRTILEFEMVIFLKGIIPLSPDSLRSYTSKLTGEEVVDIINGLHRAGIPKKRFGILKPAEKTDEERINMAKMYLQDRLGIPQ